jgi:hypothetical protein
MKSAFQNIQYLLQNDTLEVNTTSIVIFEEWNT